MKLWLKKYWPVLLLVVGVGLLIGALVLKLSMNHTVAAHGAGADAGWFTTLMGLLTGGAGLSIPAIIALVKKWLPSLGKIDPRIGQFIDVSQIGAYLFLLGKAKTPEESAALVTAGRASCDALRDGLFPLPTALVPAGLSKAARAELAAQ